MAKWKSRPERSNWGEFGVDDEIGRLNLITSDVVKMAAQEIQTGERFCLSLPLNVPSTSPNPSRRPPEFASTTRNGSPFSNYIFDRHDPRWTDVANDDQVTLCTQASTQ